LNATLQSLKESDQRQGDIVDFLPIPTLVINNEGSVLAWNQAMEKLTGVSRNSIMGKGEKGYSLPFYDERRAMLIDLAISMDGIDISQYPGLRKHGDRLEMESFLPHMGESGLYLSGAARILRDADGNPIGAIESILDITERKDAEAELQKKLGELERFNQLTIDREHRMIQLKEEINRLEEGTGRGGKYRIVT
jgi:PAS domain S-box-containing protein